MCRSRQSRSAAGDNATGADIADRNTAGNKAAGYVTAETAMVLPVFAILLAVALWAVAVAGAQLSSVDAARDGARAAARGESGQAIAEVIRAEAPRGADFNIENEGSQVMVIVRARVGPGTGPLAKIAVPVVAATAVAATESDP